LIKSSDERAKEENDPKRKKIKKDGKEGDENEESDNSDIFEKN